MHSNVVGATTGKGDNMGWANCGTDSKGRPIGYAHEATCDHPGCTKKIDRGLSYACGDMHGEDVFSCEGYFCHEHRHNFVEYSSNWGTRTYEVCDACAKALSEDENWYYDGEEGCWREKDTGD